MAYHIDVSPSARRQLKRLHGTIRKRIAQAIDDLADDPRPPGCVKLEGADDLYRVRVGDYRVVYQISDDRLIVLIVRVAHRRDVYRDG